MKAKRLWCEILAAALVLASVPLPLVSFAADVTGATLSFASGQGASVVSGGTIAINITKPDYYLEDADFTDSGVAVRRSGLNIKTTHTGADLNHIQVSGRDTNKNLTIEENFFPNPNVTPNVATLDISGAYIALMTSGSVVESSKVYSHRLDNDGNPIEDLNGKPVVYPEDNVVPLNFTISPNISVFRTSTMELVCTTSETGSRAPSFEIRSKIGDAFAEFTKAYSAPRTSDTAPLEIRMSDDDGGNERTITLTPQTSNTMDKNGDQLDGGRSRKWVQEGAVFRLSIPQASSNNVLLTVYSPKAAADVIANDAPYETGEVGQGRNFIRLASGDTKEFIRQNFEVNYDIYYFNTHFYLSWTWVPDNPLYQDTVQFPSSPSGFQTVQLDREYDDVKGKLRLDITCRARGNPVLSTVEMPITVKGTGLPASLEAHSQQTASTTLDPVTGRYEVSTEIFRTESERKMRDISLDAYDGSLGGVEQPDDPSAFTVRLNMGKDNSASLYAVVESTGNGRNLVTMRTSAQRGDLVETKDYSFGDRIDNPYAGILGGNEGVVDLTFYPNKTGVRKGQTTTVTITFYVSGAQGGAIPALEQPQTFRVTVKDSSPSNDATLSGLQMLGRVPGLLLDTTVDIDYGFAPSTFTYNVQVENQCEGVYFRPTLNDIYYADKEIQIQATSGGAYLPGWEPGPADSGTAFYRRVSHGSRSPLIPLAENQTVQVQLVVTAEDTSTQTYTINLLRTPKSTDATLRSLTLTDPEGNELFNGIQNNVFVYDVQIPFKVQRARVAYETNHPRATVTFTPALEQTNIFSERVWLNILKGCEGSVGTRSMQFAVDSVAEDGITTSGYILNITRSEPSDVNTLSAFQLLDASQGTDTNLTFSPAFRPGMEMGDGDAFDLNIPFSTNRVKVSAKASDTGATVILLAPGLAGGGLFGETDTGGDGWMILGANSASRAFTPTPYIDGQAETTYYVALVEVWPESTIPLTGTARPQRLGDVVDGVSYEDYMQKVMRYPVHIFREPASRVASLKSIELFDQEDKAVTFNDFTAEQTEYTVEVPYEVTQISVLPTATFDQVARIEVNGRRVANGAKSPLIRLEQTTTTITVVVYPEDTNAATMTYTLTIRRMSPSSDSRLVSLVVADATDFRPVFAPSRTSYTAKVAENALGVRITATANHPAAKIEIDGVRVASGVQSDLIRILEINQTVSVVVTAQDGSTTTYSVRMRNENLIEKTDNADLSDLEITPGVMRPLNFKPSLLDYEVSVDEETYSVELFPVLADSMATMRVYQDGREIGDDDDNYGGTIQDGENEFTIEVTSPDGSKEKIYTVVVYRNEEDNMGRLDPLTADEIDFEMTSDVIVVDITKYSRIAGDVFEELKSYPNKRIVFQGNDYSLEFKASELGKIIPNGDFYDFGMSFSSPIEEEIEEEIYSYSGNSGVDLLYPAFKYHGALPGPATLTMSLGIRYRNDRYYWNYYNEERQRVDYYGTISTNSRGTFSVILEHMSTYVIADQMLAGAENKTGQAVNSITRDLTSEALVQKLIPNTGAEDKG